jgi:hypothetical protein
MADLIDQTARFLAKVETHNDDPTVCWEWRGANKGNGYGHTSRGPAHRRSYELFRGPIPPKMDVCHRCDNRACVNPSHLFLGTRLDNMRDAVSKGRIARGSRLPTLRGDSCHFAKLDAAKVAIIRTSALPSKEIARLFGVSADNINRIRRNNTWKAA